MHKNCDPNEIPITTCAFFKECISLLRPEYLQFLFKRGQSQVYRYAEDPATAPNPSRNPLDRIKVLFLRLEEVGRVDLALSGLKFLADSLGMRVLPKSAPIPDKDSMEAELLDDLPHVVNLHTAISEGKSLHEVEILAEKAIRELQEDVVMYKEKLGK